MYVTKTLH